MPSKLSTNYGRVMAKIRAERGMRVLDQAKLMGIRSSNISRVETGAVRVTARYLEEVSKSLGLTAFEKDIVWEFLAKDREEGQFIANVRKHIDDLPLALIAELNAAIIAAERGV